MKGSEFFPSKYLKAEEIADMVPLTVTIKTVAAETLKSRDKGNNQEEIKPVAYFEELEKGLVLNKTNWYAIAALHGDDSDEWGGKQIALIVMDVDSFGDIVSAIRIKPVKKSAGTNQKAAPKKPAPAQWTHPADPNTPDDGWSVDTAGAITTRRGSRLGGLTPEQLEILIEKETGEIQSAAVYLRAYLQVRETPPTGGINADEPF